MCVCVRRKVQHLGWRDSGPTGPMLAGRLKPGHTTFYRVTNRHPERQFMLPKTESEWSKSLQVSAFQLFFPFTIRGC